MKKAFYILAIVFIPAISLGGFIWSIADILSGRANWDAWHITGIFVPLVPLICSIVQRAFTGKLRKLSIISSAVSFLGAIIIWSISVIASHRKYPVDDLLADIYMILLPALICALYTWFAVTATGFAIRKLFNKDEEKASADLPILSAIIAFFGLIILGAITIIVVELVYLGGIRQNELIALFTSLIIFAFIFALDIGFLARCIVHIIRNGRFIFYSAPSVLAVVILLGTFIWGVYIVSSENLGEIFILFLTIYLPLLPLVCAVIVWLLVAAIVFAASGLFHILVWWKDREQRRI